MKIAASAVVLAAVVFGALPLAALADDHDHWGGPGPHGAARMEFHEHDVHRFREHEMVAWRGGRWHQGWHDGRYGWWWFAGGAWYFYERPVYPYPPVVSEVVVVEAVPVAPPPPVVVTAPPPAVIAAPPPAVIAVPQVAPPPPPPPGPPPQQFWYYCDNPAGYYPYVQTCNTAFRQVPVTPGAAAAPAAPAPAAPR